MSILQKRKLTLPVVEGARSQVHELGSRVRVQKPDALIQHSECRGETRYHWDHGAQARAIWPSPRWVGGGGTQGIVSG